MSLEYNWDDFQFTSEYQRRSIDYSNLLTKGFDSGATAESYYLQSTYRLNSKYEFFYRYDVLYLNKNDKSGDKQPTTFGLEKHSGYAKDHTIGGRYNINPSWLIAAEYHRIKGTAWLASKEQDNINNTEEDWNLFTMQISYKF